MTPAQMAALHAECFIIPRPWSAQEITSILSSAHSFVIAQENGFLIGRAVAGEAEMLTLAVALPARRQGIGRALVQGFLRRAHENGALVAFLDVAADNAAAIGLYRECGFAQTGLRRGYYHSPNRPAVDALVLSCPLSRQEPPSGPIF